MSTRALNLEVSASNGDTGTEIIITDELYEKSPRSHGVA
jgi:hypothetical protein